VIDKAKLHKAIDLAKEPGGCRYTDSNGSPVCVIGQYAFLLGPRVLARIADSKQHVQNFAIQQALGIDHSEVRGLRDIQSLWDRIPEDAPVYADDELAEIRKRMHELADSIGYEH
jgi:hypothetical protein